MFRVITIQELRTKLQDTHCHITTDHYKALVCGQYLLLTYNEYGNVNSCKNLPCAYLASVGNELEGVHIVTSSILLDMNPRLPIITTNSDIIDVSILESQLRNLSKSALKELLTNSPAFREAISSNDTVKVICDYYQACAFENKGAANALITDLDKFIQSGRAGVDVKNKFFGI